MLRSYYVSVAVTDEIIGQGTETVNVAVLEHVLPFLIRHPSTVIVYACEVLREAPETVNVIRPAAGRAAAGGLSRPQRRQDAP